MKSILTHATKVWCMFFVLTATAFFSNPLLAADCSSSDIALGTQADVNSFQTTYGPCDTVTGNLTISGAGIISLAGLSALTSVGGYLTIQSNPALTSVDGLSALTSVGGYLFIANNTALISLSGLSALTSVGEYLYFGSNTVLTSLNGLSALTSVDRYIEIRNNTALTNLDGLSALTSVGEYFFIGSNPALTNLSGLSALTSVGGFLQIYDSAALTSLDGLSALFSVGTNVSISENPVLSDCVGLTALLDAWDDGLPGPGPGAAGIPDVGATVTIENNLPGCNSVAEIVSVIPTEGTATISIQKYFTDGNNETPVTLALKCTSGTYSPATVTTQPDDSTPASMLEHTFVVSQIPIGSDNSCSVVETPVAGYTAQYVCPPNGSTGEVDDTLCDPYDRPTEESDSTACAWTNVVAGDSNLCGIFNSPDPVDVEVTKVWDITNTGGDNFNTSVTLYISCDAEIVGPDSFHLSAGDFYDEDGYTGVATVTAKVIPDWYPAAAKQESECYAYEDSQPSGVEVTSDCGSESSPGLQVSAGNGDSCTITNTLFFEGVPTLSQYGMAIMALLMLGMGMIGFRRFA